MAIGGGLSKEDRGWNVHTGFISTGNSRCSCLNDNILNLELVLAVPSVTKGYSIDS